MNECLAELEAYDELQLQTVFQAVPCKTLGQCRCGCFVT